MLENGSQEEQDTINNQLRELIEESNALEKGAGEFNLQLQEQLKKLAATRFELVKAQKNAKSSCIYA